VTLSVVFGETAWQDFDELYDWIAGQADSAAARRYTGRIEAHCLRFGDFPDRGTPRDDLSPGVRTTVFEGRVVIVYLVSASQITILRILSHGRDIRKAFPPHSSSSSS
jgi:toxin ParE1/3/4